MAGTVFMEVGKNFGMVNGGRCVLNGSRFENSEPSGDMGPIVPLDGMDLRHSQWVAVDFDASFAALRQRQPTNFSAIHMDGEPVEMVDATGFIATKPSSTAPKWRRGTWEPRSTRPISAPPC